MLWLLRDLRSASRTLIQRPGYTAAVLFTLVLGIAPTVAVFSVVSAALLEPLPHRRPEELVLVWEVDRRPGFLEERNRVTAANYVDWRQDNRVFRSMAAFQEIPVTFGGDDDPERILAGVVSADFFNLLGVRAALGRTFVPDEDLPGNDNVVLLGHDFWQRRFAGSESIVDQAIRLGSQSYPVVGVLPAGFRFLDRDFDIWAPLGLSQERLQNRQAHTLKVVARMKPGVSVQMAQKDMERVVDGLRRSYPEFLTGWSVHVESLNDAVVGEIRPALLVLLLAVAMVLLIASVNVAHLMLVRGVAERRATAIRVALGATRRRLVQQRLTESGLLALAGGGLAVALAKAATALLLATAPEDLPRVAQIGVDRRVLVVALAVSLGSGLLVGLAAGLQGGRPEQIVLKQGSPTASRRHHRLRGAFVVSQFALSLMLLVSAGLMVVTFDRLMRVDPGFDADAVMTMKLSLPSSKYPTRAEQTALYDRLLPELARLPQLAYVGITRFLPLEDEEWTWSVRIRGEPAALEGEKRDYGYHVVSGDYFRAMGIALERGRAFDERDRPEAPPVMVVNRAFVRRFLPPGAEPVGQRMSILGREDTWIEIVGVVEDVHHYSLSEEPLPAYYGSYRQVPWDFFLREMNLVVRSSGTPEAVVPAVRQAVQGLDPGIVVSDVVSMSHRVSHSVARSRFAMTLLALFSAVAAALALVGIAGVVSHAVGQRAREIGVRMALGGEPRRIVGRFVAGGLKLMAAGIVLGLAGAVLLGRLQASLLYGVEAVDPILYGAVAGLLGTVGLLAIYLPARRASRVDPIVVLRQE